MPGFQPSGASLVSITPSEQTPHSPSTQASMPTKHESTPLCSPSVTWHSRVSPSLHSPAAAPPAPPPPLAAPPAAPVPCPPAAGGGSRSAPPLHASTPNRGSAAKHRRGSKPPHACERGDCDVPGSWPGVRWGLCRDWSMPRSSEDQTGIARYMPRTPRAPRAGAPPPRGRCGPRAPVSARRPPARRARPRAWSAKSSLHASVYVSKRAAGREVRHRLRRGRTSQCSGP
jgi:hypothetical protein